MNLKYKKILEKNITFIIFFLLMLFINQNYIIGFFILLSSGIIYKYNKKVALIFYIVWLMLLIYNKKKEKFTSTLAPSSTISPPTSIEANITTSRLDNLDNLDNLLKFRIQLEDMQNPLYLSNMTKNNTFIDIRRATSYQINMNLNEYLIYLRYKKSDNNLEFYILNETEINMTLLNYNEYAKDLNDSAKAYFSQTLQTDNILTLEQMRLRNILNNPLPIIKNNHTIIFKKKRNYDRLIFIVKNLTLLNDTNAIRIILENEKITKPYEFVKLDKQKFILSDNEENSETNIEKITFRDYTNLVGFSNLFLIYGFNDNRIIELIKKNPNLASFSIEETITKLDRMKHKLSSLETECLLYYKKEKTISPKIFDLFNLLDINKIFLIDDINELFENEDRFDKENVKNLYYIAILFTLNNIFTENDLYDTTDNWKNKVINNLAINYESLFNINDDILNNFNLRERITMKNNNNKIKLNKINFEDPHLTDLSNYDTDNVIYQSKLFDFKINKNKEIEYKTIQELNKNTNIIEQQKNMNPQIIEIDKIGTEFSNTSLDIVNDLTNLFSMNSEKFKNYNNHDEILEEDADADADADADEDSYISSNLYLHYIKQIINILTKEGRILYVGIMLLIFSILLFFIEKEN